MLAEFEVMDDRRFECALRDLLVRDGGSARGVGGGGERAVDVFGDHLWRGRIVVQAKQTPVGGQADSSVMYAVKGTVGRQRSRSCCRRHQRVSPAMPWRGVSGTASTGSTGRS
ncbi:restriction endonuclease [Streptomyces zagrosensis]|uniref:restriction endonuclease n=1 Tax=Streptomyces zagrosensis TaxID=1042984 RepID=UPI0035E4348B